MRKQRIKASSSMVEKQDWKEWIFHIVIWILLAIATFIFFIPFWHVIMASFSKGEYLIANEGIIWWPLKGEWNFGGYKLFTNYEGALKGYLNTLLYVVCGTALGFTIDVIGGYCMFRKSKLQKFFTVFILITMLFNGGVIPTFAVVFDLGLYNNPLAIIFLTCTNALYVILTMNAFRGVPYAMVEAAEIDGANHFQMIFKILLPQCVSMVSVVVLFTAVGIWNSWFEATVYLKDSSWWPLQLWINQINSENANFLQSTNPNWNKLVLEYVLIVVATVPILAIATAFQKYIEKGVALGGVKE